MEVNSFLETSLLAGWPFIDYLTMWKRWYNLPLHISKPEIS